MTATNSILVALVGNPNTGKTSLFNDLAGMNQRVGNYPGVTVETKKGKCHHRNGSFDLIDLPGTYSLSARSPDEMVAVDVILGQKGPDHKPDLVVTIVDASNLERNLYLTTQVFDLGVPVIIALNMIDVAENLGLKIDVAQLEKNLGVPIVPIQANKGKGIDVLKAKIVETVERSQSCHCLSFPEAFEDEVDGLRSHLGDGFPSVLARRLLLDVGGQTERRIIETKGNGIADHLKSARLRLAQAGCGVTSLEARTRYAWIRQAVTGCIERPAQRRRTWTDSIDRVLTNKFWGSLIFLALMFSVFVAIYFGARPIMDLIGEGQKWLMGVVKGQMSPGPLRGLIVDGIIKGVGDIVVFLPQILILFALIALLEDCGYMARAAYLMDRIMSKAGLNGKSFIPLLSSVACAVPGILSARVIENRRDRLATILIAPLMSCSARLPVYILLVGVVTSSESVWEQPLWLFGLYLIGLILAPLIALLLKRTLLRGETPAFVMEMPLYKVPSPLLVLRRAWDAGWMFLRRAGTIILATMVIIWALLYFPTTSPDGTNYEARIETLENAEKPDKNAINALKQEWKSQSYLGQAGKAIEPVVRPLGWDWKIGLAVLAAFPAREVAVGTFGIIYGEGDVDSREETEVKTLSGVLKRTGTFTIPVSLSVLVFFALCCQCASTLAVIRRETNSWGWPAFTFVYMTSLAYVGALVSYQVGSWFAGG
jgi:ferrous iron transport protein B